VDLPISHAGAFVFWLEYDGDASGERVVGRKGYFNIDPALKVKSRAPILDANATPTPPSSGVILNDREVNLPLDALSILTVVSKWMGPISGWEKHFAEARDRGYNMLHFTPLQERGESDSPYSIRDQLNYEPSMFGENLERERGRVKIEQLLKVAREQYGLLSLTDVVLNHTANDTKWLVDHPEAGRFSLSLAKFRPLHTNRRFQPSKLTSPHTRS
jgi:glycogen debranching enzyme